MKSTILLALVLFLATISIVSAVIDVQTEDLTAPLSYESLRGSDSVLRISRAITIINTGTAAENITAITLQNLATNVHLSISPATLQLAAGASQDLTVSGDVPVNLNQGLSTLTDIKLTTASGDIIKQLKGDVKPMIEISELKFYINNEKKKSSDRDKETVKDLHPGDTIQLRFQLNNLFDNDYKDGDISGNLKLKLDQSGFKQEISEKQHFQVKAGEELSAEDEEIVFDFTIPTNVEERDYDLAISLEADDDNGANYEINWDWTLQVNRKNDDIRIESFTITPTSVSCVKKMTADVKIINYGTDRQRNGVLQFTSPDLDINQKVNFELPAGEEDTNFITKQVELESTKTVAAGSYTLSAAAFYDLDILSDKKMVTVQVQNCAATGTAPATSSASTSTTTPNQPAANTAASTSGTAATGSATARDTAANARSNDRSVTSAATTTGDKISSATIAKTIEEVYTSDDYIVATMVVAAIIIIGLMVIFFLLL